MLFNWKLGLLEIFSILLLVFVMRTTTTIQKKIAMKQEVTDARLQNVTMTGMSNLETIKSLGDERYFFAQWEKAFAQALNARVTTVSTSIYISAVPEIVLQLTNGVIICLGTWLILQGELTPGMLLASQGFINETIYPINRTISSIQTFFQLSSSIQRIKEVADCGQESPDLRLPAGDDLPDVAKLAGEIELRDVTFGYDHSLPPIISHFSLKIKAGERIALVGPSGCGKSTVLSLVSGLYEPWEGEVLFDGKPRKAIDRMTFVNSVSVINQDVTLFEGTIADNVKMWDESIEDFAMVLACNDAQIHEEIMERPGAYQRTAAAYRDSHCAGKGAYHRADGRGHLSTRPQDRGQGDGAPLRHGHHTHHDSPPSGDHCPVRPDLRHRARADHPAWQPRDAEPDGRPVQQPFKICLTP